MFSTRCCHFSSISARPRNVTPCRSEWYHIMMILYHLHVSVVLLFTMGGCTSSYCITWCIWYPYWYTLYYLGAETLPCYMYHNRTIFECVLVWYHHHMAMGVVKWLRIYGSKLEIFPGTMIALGSGGGGGREQRSERVEVPTTGNALGSSERGVKPLSFYSYAMNTTQCKAVKLRMYFINWKFLASLFSAPHSHSSSSFSLPVDLSWFIHDMTCGPHRLW